MSQKDNLKKQIFSKISSIYSLDKAGRKFIPGKTMVNYGGRVYDEKELINLVDASLDFWLTAGRYAERFERKLSKFLGLKYCVLVNSGSSANLLALSALTSPKLGGRRLKPGDEVITVACGFPTTLNPILQNSLVPVFIDVQLGTYNIDADKIEKAISKRTKAIFVAHTLGNPVDLDKIMKIAKKHKLWVIEDNCDSLGSKYLPAGRHGKGKYTGTFGHLSTCSFYPPHHITMGEGGAVLTNDPLLRKIVISFRDWGRDCWCGSGHDDTCGKRFNTQFGKLPFGYDHKYVYSHIGYNMKVTDLQAAIGVAQLDKLPGFIKARKKNFSFLISHLMSQGYDKYLILPSPTLRSDPSWFGFPILVKKNAPFNRSDLVNYLENHKIATRMMFGGNLTKQPAYLDMKCRIVGGLNNTDTVMNDLFWIGVYPGIDEARIKYILRMIDDFMEGRAL
jgi:CDP-6-deoxy-D-xylo-4-hexulose-3-dehydrase